ncbi:hypothetical protein ABZ570_18385 [Micromonospora sp. NPDC007271]|uniref:hypothetical protein n=1 Tax=Micromonospora sp. NPDC007271 TaxID=3154587 RepID=UPI0033ECB18B
MTTVVAVVAGLTGWVAGREPEAPAQLDPGQQLFRLGYLPGPARLVRYDSDHDMQRIFVKGPAGGKPATKQDGASPPPRDWAVEVQMAARGIDIHEEAREYADEGGYRVPGDSVAPVRGRPAFQYETAAGRVLSWKYAPGGWMRVAVFGVDRPDEITRQVAEGIRWETAPLALPFQAVKLPDGAVLRGVAWEWVENGPLIAYSHHLLKPIKKNSDYLQPDIVVGLTTKSLASDRDNETNDVTVSGRAATAADWRKGIGGIYRVGQLPGGCARCVAEVRTPTRRGDAAVGGRKSGLELAASIRLVNGHEDPARWRPL